MLLVSAVSLGRPLSGFGSPAIDVGIPGSGGGESLIFNAHMDRGPELRADAPEAAKKIERAWVDGELIFGKRMINDKAQLCAFMIAARAIKKAGVRLKGDLTITGVAFEAGSPSVDEFQGINYPRGLWHEMAR